MADHQTKLLFVHGVQKTGTSTLVGMLNAHPKVLLLYETRMDRSMISKYGNQLLESLPESRKFFRDNPNIGEPYLQFASYLAGQDPTFSYRYIGDKIISLNPAETQPPIPHKTIYCLRDARTWLCKEQIVRYYRTDLDVVAPAVDYLRYTIGSFRYPQSLHIRLEDLVLENTQVLARLSDFLELDIATHADQWWKKIGEYKKNDPKTYIKWFLGHASSRTEPKKLDTVAEMIPQPFWEDYLPLFDKYYFSDSAADLQQDNLESDLQKLEHLMDYSPLPLSACYSNIDTQRLAPESSTLSQRSILSRIKNRLIRALT